MAEDLGGGFDAVEAGEVDVHQDEMGLEGGGESDGVEAGAGFADDAEVAALAEDGFEAIAHDFVVVDEEDVMHGGASGLGRG